MQAETLAQQLRQGTPIQVLDVRTPAEFESAHIPGSYNLPLDQLGAHRGVLGAGTQPLVLVCRSGNRAREAQMLLHSAGRESVEILEGGLVGWEQAGLPVERGRQRWSMERQVRGVAGSLVLAGALGGLLVWRPLGALAACVGGGLLYSGLTDSCGMAALLARLPYNRGARCDVSATVQALTTVSPSDPRAA